MASRKKALSGRNRILLCATEVLGIVRQHRDWIRPTQIRSRLPSSWSKSEVRYVLGRLSRKDLVERARDPERPERWLYRSL